MGKGRNPVERVHRGSVAGHLSLECSLQSLMGGALRTQSLPHNMLRCFGCLGVKGGLESQGWAVVYLVSSALSPLWACRDKQLPDKLPKLSLKHPDGQVWRPHTLACTFTDGISVVWEPLSLWTSTQSDNSPLPRSIYSQGLDTEDKHRVLAQ